MLKKIALFTLVAITAFIVPKAQAHIAEINSMNEILPEIRQDTLVLMDLDDTCITTVCMLGSSPCWDHFTKVLQSAQFDTWTTYGVIFPLVGKIIQSVPIKPIEDYTPHLIRSLQDQNIVVLSLTGRVKEAPYDPNFAFTTHSQLQKIGIDFSQSPMPPGLNPQNPPKSFAYGIIFADHKLKGPVLKKFLEEIHYHPAKVVMVEDMISHLESVEKSMNELDIPFTGFRYGRQDQVHAAFDPMIANLQLKALLTQGYIPTDEQATLWKSELLKQKPYISHDFYLEEIIMNIKNNCSSQ